MFKRLYPREYVSSIYHIDAARLWQLGKRAILTDLDNTLTTWNSPVATPKLAAWLKMVKEMGFKVCILSNNDRLRVTEFARPLGLLALEQARKPRKTGFIRALDMLHVAAGETVMIGDQIFTDILGGNRMGLYTILVQPIHSKEHRGTRFVRHIERVVLRKVPLAVAQKEYFLYDSNHEPSESVKGRNDL